MGDTGRSSADSPSSLGENNRPDRCGHGGPVGVANYSAIAGSDCLAKDSERRDAWARLTALPFPVTHDQPWAWEPTAWPRPITSVSVQLAQAVGQHERARWRRSALELGPRLRVLAEERGLSRVVRSRQGFS